MNNVTESIFSGKSAVIPMADVQHIEKQYHSCDLVGGTKKGDLQGSMIITKHTRWDMEADTWANNIWLGAEETHKFLKAWCRYRHELELDTIARTELFIGTRNALDDLSIRGKDNENI